MTELPTFTVADLEAEPMLDLPTFTQDDAVDLGLLAVAAMIAPAVRTWRRRERAAAVAGMGAN